MTRPKSKRIISQKIKCFMLVPQAECCEEALDYVNIYADELEAINLSDLSGLKMREAADLMGISAPTFQRLLSSGHKKLADSIINKKIVKICKYY